MINLRLIKYQEIKLKKKREKVEFFFFKKKLDNKI